MLAFNSLITLDRTSSVPIYLQIANGMIQQVQNGVLKSGLKLPGSRQLSASLQVHRKTIVRAIEELDTQGWVKIIRNKGTFISEKLPLPRTSSLSDFKKKSHHKEAPGFSFHENALLTRPLTGEHRLAFDDGFPDTRLAPLKELASAQARLLRQHGGSSLLSYNDPLGYTKLRQVLAKEFNLSRGLNITADHLMITRGSQMALFLAATTLLKKGDRVIVGEINYYTANLTFRYLGAQLVPIPVDKHGLVVEAIDEICRRQTIRAIFVTSHHHHPTTVTLAPARRLRLLELAEKYGFVIIEDDYDYEFNYGNGPLLPLASADRSNLVIYVGSFSKSVSPAIRVGYLVGPPDFITALGKLRRLMDRQGDMIQEAAFAELLEEGVIRRYHKKALKQYHLRRDHAANLLRETVGDHLRFDIPEGGLAFWVNVDTSYSLKALSQKAKAKHLYLSDGLFYTQDRSDLNAIRMGFASMNLAEMGQAIDILKSVIDK